MQAKTQQGKRDSKIISVEEEQAELLEEAKKKVKVEAFHMKRCLDSGKIKDALKHASSLIGQLRTSLLTPKSYYELYITSFDQLRYLESYLFEEKQKGEKMSKLYELVQYAGNILPRQYLLITVGSVYIKSQEAPAKDVLRDLVEMCRGVQHPTRGLFLRNYLSEMTKDKLPDVGSAYEGAGGTVADSVDFILQNFTEMNKLWVRMQPKGPSRDRERRESERRELRLLVGKNLARLGQLEGVNIDLYSETVLPRILEQIINCKDQIAQQYLMECVIQVFPDEFHIHTLEQFLASCVPLQEQVDLKSIIVSLIDRLMNFATRYTGDSAPAFPDNIAVFDILFANITKIIQQRSKLPLEDTLSIHVSLLNFSLKCFSTRVDYTNQIFDSSNEFILEKKNNSETAAAVSSPKVAQQIVKLLTIPQEIYRDVLRALDLNNYLELSSFLDFETRKKVATTSIKNVLSHATVVSDVEHLRKLLNLIAPLLGEEGQTVDEEEFRDDHQLLALLVHLLRNPNPEENFLLYLEARSHFAPNDKCKAESVQYTLVPLVTGCLPLIRLICATDEQEGASDEAQRLIKRMFKFILETIVFLVKKQLPDVALRLYLLAALSADAANIEAITYNFVTRVFQLYEEEIASSKAQIAAIVQIIGSVQILRNLNEENYDTVATKCAMLSSKLINKPDQCKAICLCSHLFWKDGYNDHKRVKECLERSRKIAEFVNQESTDDLYLFVDVLNQYIYYLNTRDEEFPVSFLNRLLEMVQLKLPSESLPAQDEGETTPGAATEYSLHRHYKNTLEYLRSKKQSGDPIYANANV
eukprot:TRINITY_DN5601_c0_g1_i1.p1 TRINITY_DN5601_c0_g1~~TRINITY_DN5601_c0_g1_i1.p1  ORF type:complete len:812 (+),score=177.93 TRINITY_DN5601_c0_g1_i1:75-2510(+)